MFRQLLNSSILLLFLCFGGFVSFATAETFSSKKNISNPLAKGPSQTRSKIIFLCYKNTYSKFMTNPKFALNTPKRKKSFYKNGGFRSYTIVAMNNCETKARKLDFQMTSDELNLARNFFFAMIEVTERKWFENCQDQICRIYKEKFQPVAPHLPLPDEPWMYLPTPIYK